MSGALPGALPGTFPGVPGLLFVVLLGAAVPAVAVFSARVLGRAPLPPRPTLFRAIIARQGALLAVALVVAWLERVPLFAVPRVPSTAALAAVAVTVCFVVALRPTWRREVGRRERRAYLTMPRTARERRLWVGVSFAAGIAEEVAYRGVLYALLVPVVGGAYPAALLSAAAFGAARAVQGVAAGVTVAGVGLLLQWVVACSGSLLPAVAIHVAYDVVAGFAYGRLGEQFGYPVEGVPAAGDVVAEGGGARGK